ncbi:hypothetical protein N9M16_08705 [Candidatus Dependentiae bacterium]|nr:hypothetical protein [Candidatus Dependentiae bacterium]
MTVGGGGCESRGRARDGALTRTRRRVSIEDAGAGCARTRRSGPG